MTLAEIKWTHEIIKDWYRAAVAVESDKDFERFNPCALSFATDLKFVRRHTKRGADGDGMNDFGRWREIRANWDAIMPENEQNLVLWMVACGLSFRRIAIVMAWDESNVRQLYDDALNFLATELPRFYKREADHCEKVWNGYLNQKNKKHLGSSGKNPHGGKGDPDVSLDKV